MPADDCVAEPQRGASDKPTAYLLTQRIAVHAQTAWMLRSLLQE